MMKDVCLVFGPKEIKFYLSSHVMTSKIKMHSDTTTTNSTTTTLLIEHKGKPNNPT